MPHPIELVHAYRSDNLIWSGQRFLAAFQGVTEVDLENPDLEGSEPGRLFAAGSLDELRQQVDAFVDTHGVPQSFRNAETNRHTEATT